MALSISNNNIYHCHDDRSNENINAREYLMITFIKKDNNTDDGDNYDCYNGNRSGSTSYNSSNNDNNYSIEYLSALSP